MSLLSKSSAEVKVWLVSDQKLFDVWTFDRTVDLHNQTVGGGSLEDMLLYHDWWDINASYILNFLNPNFPSDQISLYKSSDKRTISK